jgi:hypothetical protein
MWTARSHHRAEPAMLPNSSLAQRTSALNARPLFLAGAPASDSRSSDDHSELIPHVTQLPQDGHHPRYHACPPHRGLPCLRGRPRTRYCEGAASDPRYILRPKIEGRGDGSRDRVGPTCSMRATAKCVDVHARRYLPAANSFPCHLFMRGVGWRPLPGPSSSANPDQLLVAHSSPFLSIRVAH